MMPKLHLRLTGKIIAKISGHCWQRRLTARMWLTTPPGDVPVVRLSFLHIGGTGQPTIPLNPGLSDERFEYAATTSLETVTMTATVPIGASVRWLFEHVITIGQTRTVDLLPGASHLVNITVTQSGHRSSNYALVITRA